MRPLLTMVIAAAPLIIAAGCGTSSDQAEGSSSASSAPTVPPSPSPTGLSDDCQLAALDWSHKANEAVIGFALGDAGLDLVDARTADIDKIKVYCTSELEDMITSTEFNLVSHGAQVHIGDADASVEDGLIDEIKRIEAELQ